MRSYFKTVTIAALSLFVAVFSSLEAQTIDFWIRLPGGNQNWNTTSHWQLGTPPQAAGDIAHIMADITGNQVIVLGGTQTVGTINLGDFNGSNTFTLGQLATSDLLSFDNSTWGGVANLGGRASLNKVQGNASDTVADVQLVSDLSIYTRVGLIMAGNITELNPGASLLKRGTSNLTLSGINSYTGDTIIHTTGGTVFLNTTGGEAIASSLIRLGNSGRDGSSTVRLQLSQSNQINDATVIRFDGAGGREAFFQLNGRDETIAGIQDVTSNGVIENANGSIASTLTLEMGATDSSYNGYLRNGSTGTLAVVKNGTGTLTLAGGRISFTGGMTVNNGKLVLSNLGNNLFGSNVNLVAPTSSLDLNATADYVFTRAVFGAGSVSKSGTSTVTMTQASSATGTFALTNGTLRLSGAGGGITGASSIDLSGGTLQLTNRTASSKTGGSTTANSATVTVDDTTSLAPGMTISGPNIPAGATIVSITNATQMVISAVATGTGGTGTSPKLVFTVGGGNSTDRIDGAIPITSIGGGIRFENSGVLAKSVQWAAGVSSLTLTDTAGITVGMTVTGTGIPGGTTVTNVSGLTVTISNATTSIGTDPVFNGSITKKIGLAAGVSSYTVPDVVDLIVGAPVAGAGIQPGTVISGISDKTITLSLPTVAAGGFPTHDVGSYSESVGTLTLGSGATVITSGTTGVRKDALNSTLTFAGLTRQAHSTLNFANAGTGAQVGLGTSNKVLFSNPGALTLDDGIVGGWATVGNEWATYGANGVAALDASGYSSVRGGKTGSWTSGVSSITIDDVDSAKADADGLFVGMLVTGSLGIQPGTTITGISGSTISLSLPTNAAGNTPVFGTWAANGNIKMTGGNATMWLPSNTTINSLNIQNPAASTLNLNGKELTIASGGIIVSGNANITHTIGTNNSFAGVLKVGVSAGHAPGFSELVTTVEASRNLTLFSQVSNNGATPMTLVKNGGGKLILTPFATNNLYSGGTYINGGSIEIKDLGNLGTNADANFLVMDGGALEQNAASITFSAAGTRQITMAAGGGRFELDIGETLTVDSGVPITGPGKFTLGGGDGTGGSFNANSVMSMQGGLQVSAGLLNLNNVGNTFTGGVTITGGTLSVPIGGGSGTIPVGQSLNMTGGTLQTLGGDVTFSSLTAPLNSNIVINSPLSATANTNLIIDQEINSTYGGRINDISKSINLYKDGTGTLTLSATSSNYTGITTITEGVLGVTTLRVFNSLSGSSLGRGAPGINFNSADRLVIDSGAALSYVGALASATNRAFTMGLGADGAAIYANGTVTGAAVIFNPRTLPVALGGTMEVVKFSSPDVGPATLTLGGLNAGQNTFGLKLVDNGVDGGSGNPNFLSLVKTGSGTWILSNANNTYSGSTTVYEGRLIVSADGALGSKGVNTPPVQVLGGVLDLRNVDYTAVGADTEDLILGGGRLDTSSGTSAWGGKIDIISSFGPNVSAGRSAQLTLSDINGPGLLDKDGFGAVVLTGTNSYTGSTRIRDGVLTLDYTTTPGDNKLANTATLVFGGGRTGGILTILGNTSGTDETVGNTTLERGQHEIVRGDAGNARIDLKAISVAAGALLDIEEDNLALTITNNNASLAAGGILGPWATVGHTTWAYKDAGNGLTGVIRGLSNLQYTANVWGGTATNTDALINFSVPAGSTTNTIRFNQAGTPVTVTLSGSNTLQSGGILVTPNVNVVHQITGGTLTSGTGSSEVVVQQFSPTSGFVINSVITNRVSPSAATIGVQKLGPGVLALTSDNTYTGVTTIGAGTVLVNKLTDGGVAGPLGQATFAAANTVLAGGTLEYAGESATVDRGFTVREFGSLNVGDEDMTLTISGSELTANVGAIVGDSGTAFWEKNGAGTLRLLRKEVSGGASGIQQLDVTDGKLILEWGYSTTFSPLSPSGPAASNQLLNNNASLRLSGGKFELIGEDFVFNNGNSLQQILGQFVVGSGASELQVTSKASLNPSVGASQTTTLAIGDANNALDIARELGGTVLFVENPNGGTAAITLASFAAYTNTVLPWATYWDKSSIVQPGVNNFASIEPTGNAIESADANSLYAVKSNPANWTNNGFENISEEGATAFSGNVTSGAQISTLRFFNNTGAGTLTLDGTLTLTNGAILAAYNVRDNVKTITGGTLTSTYLPEDGQAELMIHNYNGSTPLLIQSVIANPTGLAVPAVLNLVHTGTGTTSLSGTNTYTGKTLVTGGVLKLDSAGALPGGIAAAGGTSALTLDGGVIGLTAASGNFQRGLGSGASQVQWLSSGGFAAYGGNRSVNIGGSGTPAQVTWGINGFVPSGDTLILGAADASGTLDFQNPVELGLTDRLVRVENGSAAEDAVMSGSLTGFGSLTKNGEGTLRLTGANTHLGGVTLAEGTLYVPSPAVLGTGTLSVGTTGNTSPNDAPVLVLESGTIANAFNVGNKNTDGITSVEVPDNVTLNGAVSLGKTGIFVGPDSGKTLTMGNVVSGTGGLTLVDGGKVVLNGANTYGSGAGAAGTAIDGSTIIRNGTVEVRSPTALGDGTKAVELGDTMIAPITVDRATTGASLIASKGTFDPNGNGVPFSVNGEGAFYDISSTIDGFTYTGGDVGKLILVKDQFDNPEQNGVYKIISVGLGGAGTMNISREINITPQFPLHTAYGTGVTVQNGTLNSGKSFFVARNVDVADINVDGYYWKAETSFNPGISLLVGGGLAAPITNPIDINDTNGTGTTTIGFASDVVRGTTTLSGNVTLQSQTTDPEDKDLFLNAEVCADLVFGGSITDPGAGDTLNLVKTGTGTVTLAGANDFNGTTRVQAGVLKLDNASALGASNSGSGNLNIAGGIVGLTTASGDLTARTLGTGAGQIQWSDSGGFAAFGTDRTVNVGASVTWGSTPGFVATGKNLVFGTEHATNKATLSTSIALGTTRRTVQVDNGPAAVEGELSGVLSAAGASGGSILKTGHGTLLISNNGNSFGDSIVVQQGVLQGSANNAFGGVTVDVGSASTTAGDLAGVEFIADPVGTATLTTLSQITVGNNPGIKRIDATNGPNVAPANADVQVSNQVTLQLNQPGNNHVLVGPDANARLQFNSTVTGAGGITVVDGGTLILAGSNTYGTSGGVSGSVVDGGTILRNGTIEVRNNNALGATTVELGDLTTRYTAVDRASNGISLGECGALFSSGTWSNVDAIFDGVTYTNLDAGKRLLIKDELASPERNGIYTIQSVSGGAMTLVRVSDFDQTAEMGYGSQVPVTNGSSAGQSYFLAGGVATVNTSPLSWQPTVANPNVALVAGTSGLAIANNIDLNASGSTGTTTLGAVDTVTSGTVTFSGNVAMQSLNAGVENLIVDITSASITSTATGVTFSGTISDGPDSLQLRKVGAGVATLSGDNTFDGGTQVNAGVLLVNNSTGSGTGAGIVTVSGVGTVLGGTGTIAGSTAVNTGAILMPGGGVNDANASFDSSVESLAFGGALALNAGSKVVFQLNGSTPVTGYDQVLVTGGLTVDATAIIQVVLGYTPGLNTSFNLFDWGGLSSDGNLVDQLQLPTLSAGTWDTSQFDTLGVLSVVIPEPSRMVLVLMGALAGLMHRRRSRSC